MKESPAAEAVHVAVVNGGRAAQLCAVRTPAQLFRCCNCPVVALGLDPIKFSDGSARSFPLVGAAVMHCRIIVPGLVGVAFVATFDFTFLGCG